MEYLLAVILAIFYFVMLVAFNLWTLLVLAICNVIYILARCMPSPIDDKLFKFCEYLMDRCDLMKKFFPPSPSAEMIIFIGLPASGKTTFYQQNFAGTYIHISIDILHLRERENKILEENFPLGKPFVIDNANVTAFERSRYIRAGKKHDYKIIGYYFNSSIDECRIRNDQRPEKEQAPEIAFRDRAAHLELPSMQEGFDELHSVKIVDGKFEVTAYQEV